MRSYRYFSFLLILVFTLSFLPISVGAYGVGRIASKEEPDPNGKYCGINRADNERENSIFDDAINAYLAGEDVNAIDLGDGNVKIIVEDEGFIEGYIIIPVKNNLDQFRIPVVKNAIPERSSTSTVNVTSDGVVTKPGYSVSNTVCAPRTGPVTHTYEVSSSFTYQTNSSAGIKIKAFEAELGITLTRSFSLTESYTYKVPKRKCGTVYASEVYNKYTYTRTKHGITVTSTLLEPKNYLVYFIVR